jgi:hypothetical protein
MATDSKKVKLTIHAMGEDKSDVFLSHNFNTVLIQRGKEVEIDEKYVGVLDAAVVEQQMFNEKGEPTEIIRTPQYNYTVR